MRIFFCVFCDMSAPKNRCEGDGEGEEDMHHDHGGRLRD
jgi:hypothetical protein